MSIGGLHYPLQHRQAIVPTHPSGHQPHPIS